MLVDETTGRPVLNEREAQKRLEYIRGLRALADWMELRPGMPAPYACVELFYYSACYSKEETAALIREAGKLEKKGDKDDDDITLITKFGDLSQVRILVDKKSTCERVKVGEKTIPAKPETIVPAEPEKVVDVFEWQCNGPILAALQEPQTV